MLSAVFRSLRQFSLPPNPANTRVVKDIETENLNSENLSGDTPHEEGFSKNEEVQSPVSEEVSRPPSEDDYLSGPETFEEDGLTVEYIRERSE